MVRYLCLLLVLFSTLSCGGGGGTGPGPGPGPGPDPIVISATSDSGRGATATLPRSGGTVTATAADGTVLELTVPDGALLRLSELTLTPLATVTGLPYSGGLLSGAEVSPADLQFAEPVTLRITPPAGFSPDTAHGFTIATPAPAGSGLRSGAASGEFGAYPGEPLDGDGAPGIEMRLSQGGVFGIGTGTGGEDHLPSARDARRTAELALLLDEARTNGTPLTDPTLRATLIALFERDWPSISAECPAASDDFELLASATQSFNLWRRQLQQVGLESEFAAEIEEGLTCLSSGFSNLLQSEAALPCTPGQAGNLLFLAQNYHWMGLLNRPGGLTTAQVLALIRPCVQFSLTLDETFTTHDSGNSYSLRYASTIPLTVQDDFLLAGDAELLFISGVAEFGDTGCCVTEIVPVSTEHCLVSEAEVPVDGEAADAWKIIFHVNTSHSNQPVENLRFNCTACDPPTDQQIANSYWLMPFFEFYKSQELQARTIYQLSDWTAASGATVAQRSLARSLQPGGPGLTFEESGQWTIEHTPGP